LYAKERRVKPIRSAIIVAILAFAAESHAADLVVNGSFDSDLSGWTASGAGISFDATNGAPDAGSVHIVAANPATSTTLTQCIDITPTGNVDLLASAQPHSATGGATAVIRIAAYNATTCSGIQLGTFGGAAVSTEIGTNGIWTRYGFLVGSLPAATRSIAMQLIVSTPNAGDAIDISWDHIQFGDSGTLPVELQSFEVD
jgi:hypothetical protein